MCAIAVRQHRFSHLLYCLTQLNSSVGIAKPLLNQTVTQPILIKMANPEMKSPKQPPNQPPENSPPDNPAKRAARQPPQQPLQQPPQQPPDPGSIYAPRNEPPPEAGTSPLMWAWVLFTALLAGLVAWSWVQYLQEPKPSTSKTAPASVEPALPTEPLENTAP
jgi:hypothetical protein